MENRKHYKEYLEPGSEDCIPSSSVYRYKKFRTEEVNVYNLLCSITCKYYSRH